MNQKWMIGAAPLLLAACMGSYGEPGVTGGASFAEAQNFVCDRSDSARIAFGEGKALLTAGGATAMLTAQPTGSGYLFKGEGHEIRGKGYELTWKKPDGQMRSCREEKWAMSQPQIQPPAPPTALAGTKWQLVHFQSSDDSIGTKVPPSVERYTLEFKDDGSAALQLDCNRAMSQWKAEPSSPTGGGLSMGPGPMTRAMCQPGAMDTQIARDLANIRSYTFRGELLGLALQADAGIYLWKIVR
ncbi:MAG: META domain-containing protein [Sphingopyxis sp.]|nr:META domain-containing protein [Sphingopyxis sp.]